MIVLNLSDVALMLVAVILVPYLYLALPRLALALFIGAAVVSVLHATAEPVLRRSSLSWAVALGLAGANAAATTVCPGRSGFHPPP